VRLDDLFSVKGGTVEIGVAALAECDADWLVNPRLNPGHKSHARFHNLIGCFRSLR
jgi:hypothetical protein